MKKSIITLLVIFMTCHLSAQNVSVFDETIVLKDNLEPIIPRPNQEKIASKSFQS
jgi:hypothetical protein